MQLGPVPCLPGRRRCLSTSLMRVASLIDKLIQMVATSFTERSLDEVDPCQTKVLAHAALSKLTVHDRISHAHRRRDPENRRCVPAQVLQQTITDNAGKHRHGVDVAGASTDAVARFAH